MLNRTRMTALDKRDEMIVTLIAIIIPLVTLPAMVS